MHYGVDKPDTRFELLLRDLTGIVEDSGFRVFADAVAAGGIVKGICVKGGDDLSRGDIEGQLTDVATRREGPRPRVPLEARRRMAGRDRQVLHRRRARGDRRSHGRRDRGLRPHGGRPSRRWSTQRSAPSATTSAARARLYNDGAHRHALGDRVSDVRTQQGDGGDRRGPSSLHDDPRRRPRPPRDASRSKVRSRAYDLVVNGTRDRQRQHPHHRPRDPAAGLSRPWESTPRTRERSFGFLLEAFRVRRAAARRVGRRHRSHGHGGARHRNIREVIAFPKNQQAQEPMTDAPAPVDPTQLRELGLAILPPTRTP